jgi:hypothetical protein
MEEDVAQFRLLSHNYLIWVDYEKSLSTAGLHTGIPAYRAWSGTAEDYDESLMQYMGVQFLSVLS